jgi:hypothetical protein
VNLSTARSKVGYVYRQQFATHAEAIRKISDWIDGFYNLKRRHSANNGMSPIDFEECMSQQQPAVGGRGRAGTQARSPSHDQSVHGFRDRHRIPPAQVMCWVKRWLRVDVAVSEPGAFRRMRLIKLNALPFVWAA